jgi:hypothetical protein
MIVLSVILILIGAGAIGYSVYYVLTRDTKSHWDAQTATAKYKEVPKPKLKLVLHRESLPEYKEAVQNRRAMPPMSLQEQLQEALAEEDYMAAARIRDEIKAKGNI